MPSELVSKMQAEYLGGRNNVDIVLGGGHESYPELRKMGMLDQIIDIIPGLNKLDKRTYSTYGDWIVAGSSVYAPQYNTKLVSNTEAPKNWQDLLDPKWKGQLGLATDLTQWPAIALDEGGWGIEKTGEFLSKLKEQKIIWASGHTAAHNMVVAGESKVLGLGLIHLVMRSKGKGAPVEWVKANPVVVSGSSISLQKKAPHPTAARLFLEWFFSPQGMILWEEISDKGDVSPGSGSKLAKEIKGMDRVYITEQTTIKSIEIGLIERFANILGISPEAQ